MSLDCLAANPNQRLVLVTHSMGGLVAALAYRQLSPAAERVIAEVVLVGPPLAGSFDVVTAMSGEHILVALLASITPFDTRDDYRRMARSLPGLLEMLPSPAVFCDPIHGDAQTLYRRETWPVVYAPLRQAWLDRARTLGPAVVQSPLLERANVLAASNHWTLASFTSDCNGHPVAGDHHEVGDGMVPLRSAGPQRTRDLRNHRRTRTATRQLGHD